MFRAEHCPRGLPPFVIGGAHRLNRLPSADPPIDRSAIGRRPIRAPCKTAHPERPSATADIQILPWSDAMWGGEKRKKMREYRLWPETAPLDVVGNDRRAWPLTTAGTERSNGACSNGGCTAFQPIESNIRRIQSNDADSSNFLPNSVPGAVMGRPVGQDDHNTC